MPRRLPRNDDRVTGRAGSPRDARWTPILCGNPQRNHGWVLTIGSDAHVRPR